MRKKRTALEEEISQAWEELAFRDHPFPPQGLTEEKFLETQREEFPGWQALFAKAYDGEKWLVGLLMAKIVGDSLWSCAMRIGEYTVAETVMVQCLKHPSPFDRGASAELPIRLNVARFARDRSPEAAKNLEDWLNCGIYAPGTMARNTFFTLFLFSGSDWYNDREDERPLPEEARALARSIAIARKTSKRHIVAAGSVQTLQEWMAHITESCGWTVGEDGFREGGRVRTAVCSPLNQEKAVSSRSRGERIHPSTCFLKKFCALLSDGNSPLAG